MATGIECCAACACLTPLLQRLQDLFCAESTPCVGGDCVVRITNFCNNIFCCNGCNCFSSNSTNYHGNVVSGNGVMVTSEPQVAAQVLSAIPQREAPSLSERVTHKGFELSV